MIPSKQPHFLCPRLLNGESRVGSIGFAVRGKTNRSEAAGEMAQQLGILAALLEELDSSPNTYRVVGSQPTIIPIFPFYGI